YPADCLESLFVALFVNSRNSEFLLWLNAVLDWNFEDFRATESQRFSILAVEELERKDTHTNKVASVDSLEAFSYDCAHTQELDTLGGPVPAGTHTVVLAGNYNCGNAGLPIP